MVSLQSTKFHEILVSSFRGVALTNCVTDRRTDRRTGQIHYVSPQMWGGDINICTKYKEPKNVDGNLVFLDCDALGYSVIFAWRIFRTMYIIFRLLLVHALTYPSVTVSSKLVLMCNTNARVNHFNILCFSSL